MKTYVIGDIHGAGKELEGLLDKMGVVSGDRIIFVGDLFDRGIYADVVWNLIIKHRIEATVGNHELKLIKFLRGEVPVLPVHYYIALQHLMNVITPGELLNYLESMPMMIDGDGFRVVHAGVNIQAPNEENVSWNVYGNFPKDEPMPRPQAGDGHWYWWDHYQGEKLVLYGHLVTSDELPRLRYSSSGEVNSIGLDTGAVHGGSLTGYCIEDRKFYSFKSGVDWYGIVQKMKHSNIRVPGVVVDFANKNRKDGFAYSA